MFPFIPLLFGTATVVGLFAWSKGLFGTGDDVPTRSGPPDAPNNPPGTNNPGEHQRGDANRRGHGGVDDHAGGANTTQGEAGGNSADGRDRLDQILDELKKVTGRNGGPDGGGTPETQHANDQAVRDGLQQLRDTVGGTDAANRGLAGQLPMPGMGGIPGMGGMSPLGGMPGMGAMPGMGGMSPLGPMGGGPGGGLGAVHPLGDQHTGSPAGPVVNPLAPAGGADPGPGVHPAGLEGGPADHSGADPHPSTPGAGGADPAAAHPDTPQPGNSVATQVVAADGTKTTAPNATIATALRHGLAHPSATNQAAEAYQSAGVQLPADGADPGTPVPSGSVQPGDIASWDDPPHSLLVFGDGKLIDSSGKLEDLKAALASGVFNGFFRPHIAGAGGGQATQQAGNDHPADPPVAATPGVLPHHAPA